jgi:hypothetical protein
MAINMEIWVEMERSGFLVRYSFRIHSLMRAINALEPRALPLTSVLMESTMGEAEQFERAVAVGLSCSRARWAKLVMWPQAGLR